MDFKEKKEPVIKLISTLNLGYTSEDKEIINRLIESYFRKKTNIVNSNIENLAGGLLWVYSRINFLFEKDKSWSQQSIAEMLKINPKTISNTASKIMSSLKIGFFDDRFTKKEIAQQNPMNDFFMTSLGFIIHKDEIIEIIKEPNIKLPKENSKQILNKNNFVKNENNSNKNKKLTDFFK